MKSKIQLILFIMLIVSNKCLFSQSVINTFVFYFETDKAILSASQFLDFKNRADIQESDTLVLTAHCDSRGSESYNQQLSEKRLTFIKSLIISSSSNLDKVVWVADALGENNPAASNETPEGMAKNRRVELIIKPQIQKSESAEVEMQSELEIASVSKNDLLSKIEESRKTGQSVAIDNLLFFPGVDLIRGESTAVLNELLDIMKSNPTLRIEIQGHICCTSNSMEDGMNNRTGSNHLSLDRAKAVYDYLVRNGISLERMEYQGFGGSRKVYDPEEDEFQQNKNRRVEIKILK